ncbi:hypothetical protein L7F22_035991 [Adiantum nelumboides]|nr:hypothetical protein [Adiantum nelumboides]
MATGDRRLGSSQLRRGMTVLGKIPAVPKPINLPSQRLENRGLDPSVEIVPRGTFSWGTGRSPPSSSSSWGTVGLASSPPVSSGPWNSASTSSSLPSSNNNSNLSRPTSAGSARPASAESSRPLSASTASGRAWGGAVKLEEQVQPSRFNLTTAEFPTLGSEKNLNLRPQQTPSNRPTSADAMKERHLAYGDHYQSGSLVERPTSADGTKERKPVFPGVSHADRPTSADGTHPDKGRQQPALLPSHPPFADGNLPDQRHPVYTGVVGHGTAGPGPGTLDQRKDNYSSHPVPVQHVIPAQGRELVFAGAPQHDRYYNRPGGPPGNDVVVLPMDARPEFYGSYAFDSRPNHPDMSRVHHPQPSWGPNHLERSGIPQGQFLQSGPSEHFHIMRPPLRRMEAAVLHEPVVGNRRDGFGIGGKAFGEQRGGWPGTNVVYIGSAIDARESSIPMAGTGQEFPRPDMFLSSWGPQPMHAAWGTVHGADRAMGVYQDMPSSAFHQQAKLMETPQGSAGESVSDIKENREKGTTRIDEVVHSRALGGHHSAAFGNNHIGRQDMHHSKQEETVKTSSVKILSASPDITNNKDNVQASGGPLVGTQPSKTKQEDGGTKAEQNREPKKFSLIPNMASQRQGNNYHGNLQGSHRDRFADKDNTNGSWNDVKGTSKKKSLTLQQSIKEEVDLSLHEREERTLLVKASDGNLINCSNLSSADLLAASDNDILKVACTDDFSRSAEDTQLKTATKDLKAPAIPNSVPPINSEEEKALLDDALKTKRNGHSVRRTHGRSLQESHSVDRQHVNHGLVWAPKPTALGATKEEVQVPSGDAGDVSESLQKVSTDLVKNQQTLLVLEHESKGENQVQQMQSAAISQQGQGRQMQEESLMNSKRSVQQVQHQRGERSSKKQGHRIQQQQARPNVVEHSVQEEQSVLHVKHEQSVINVQAEPPGGLVTAVSEREALVKQISSSEEAEKAGEATSTPALEKSEGKRYNSAYVRKPARNQHRVQPEQDHEGTNNHHGQRSYSKEEKSVAEDQENNESKKNRKEFKSRSSKNAKQQKGDLHEATASLASGDGHVLSVDRSQAEIRAETCVPYLAVEAKVVKDKEERSHNQRLGRQQEMHIKQSAAGEHRHFGEEHKVDTSCESLTSRTEKKLYVPKQARKLYLQQECEATGLQGHMIQEVYSSNEKGQYNGQGSQPLGTPIRKNDMERYTPLPARQPYMQGQQSIARGQHRQMTADLAGAQAIQPSSGYAGGQLAHITDSTGKGDEVQPCTMEHCVGRAPLTAESAHGQRRQRNADLMVGQAGKGDESHPRALGHTDESRLHESSESVQSKKDVKQYVVKSGGQQQSLSKVDEEAPIKEERWQRSNRISATDSSKRKEGMKLYTPKPARQSETSVVPERKAAQETGVPSLPEHHDAVSNEKEEKSQEFDHSHKNRNHSSKALKYTPLSRSSKKSFPSSEDRNNSQTSLEGTVHVYGADDTNGSVKEHRKDLESSFAGSRRGTNDTRPESPSFEDVEVAKPRHYQRRHYQYQPVAQQQQMVKPQVEELNTLRQNNKQSADQGHNRYERREWPRRGRGHGYGYRAGEHADSSDMR